VIATNQNDILHRCMQQGEYSKRGVVPSISPSMDIEVSSNFERALFWAHGKDAAAVAALMNDLNTEGAFRVSDNAMTDLASHYDSGSANEKVTSTTITHVLESSAELLCPHSAVGVHVAVQHAKPKAPMVALGTAHPAKFPAAVEEATGIHPPLPKHMADLYDRPERITRVANDLSAIEAVIREKRAK
ncbi:MAG: threonine synthase, partial [Pseudomonadota bacterium]